MELNQGIYGAKRQSWERNNARGLLIQIVEDNPDTDDETLFHIFSAQCAPYFPEIVRYWFANNLRALRPRAPISAGPTVDRAVAKQAAQAVRARATKLVLLDFKLPNGKMLRDCTFSECAKAGGWLSKLSTKGQPGEIVGAVLTEKEVRAVWTA